jgi:hypothetical protein
VMTMSKVVELRFTVTQIGNVTTNEKVLGLVFYEIVLTKKSEDIVTDRLVVSDEAVQVMGFHR